jgi:hypothetical protein
MMRAHCLLLLCVTSCTTAFDVPANTVALPKAIPDDVFDTLKNPADAHDELCEHDPTDTTFPNNDDALTKAFCQDVQGGVVPAPTGLADLLRVLHLDFKDPTGGNGTGGNPAFAILGHSSALTAREVSSIHPTAFVFTPLNADGSVPTDYIFLAYDPGESFVEVAAYSPPDMAINLYLVLFDKACSPNCGPTDMLTPRQTTGWSNVRIYESSTALNNTVTDCRQCHIGAGHDDPNNGDALILRMQEIEAPHTHWFSSQTDGGKALLADFHAAHGTNEDYGPIPAALIDKSDPEQMAAFIRAAGFANQPNAFPSNTIESEVTAAAPQQPRANVPMGWSATWNSLHDQAVSGNAIAPPYHDVKITDPDRLAHMTSLYQDWLSGRASTLPEDTREVLLASGLVDIGFAAPQGLDGRALLVQQCQQCHNARLDPTITRDQFLVDNLDQMSRDEKDLAIQRIEMSIDTRLSMPPPLFRLPTQQERELMIKELQK